MSLVFTPMTEADAREILSWRYDGVYAAYNAPDPALGAGSDYMAEYLDERSPYFAVREQGQADAASPIGFFAYGSACEVGGAGAEEVATPALLRPDGSLTIGLGLRPDATGQGRGLALVETGLAFAREHFRPTLFRLYVFSWNERALRVYKRVGFMSVGVARIQAPEGVRVFIEMTRAV
jgi:RimJ/RimL family protein N-acetyltransferase